LRSKKRNSAAVEKSESESKGGQKFLPSDSFPFCPPAFRAEGAAGVGSGSFLRQQEDKARKVR